MRLNILHCAPALSSIPVIILALAGCSNDGVDTGPATVVNIGFDGGTKGCSQQSFPADEPDLSVLNPPIFLLTTTAGQQSSTGQAQVRPGEPMEAEVTVNSATRHVMVELANGWAPEQVIYSDELETAGNETLSLFLFSADNVRGRYYMRITLCGFDCDERAVVFDTVPCTDDPEVTGACGINAPYERTLIEDGEVVRVDDTCTELDARPDVGSGTILIQ